MTAQCEQLDAYLDERLSSDERAAFEAHLASCEACQPVVARWQQTGARLEVWAAPFAGPPSDDALRRFRARAQRPARSVRPLLVAFAAGAMVLVAVVFAARRGPRVGQDDAWPVRLQVGETVSPADTLVALGSAEAARRYLIGPDAVEVAPAAQLDLVEKTGRRTRLKLTRGALTAHVEPGHAGRQFIVDSPPFRVTVVGTVFEVRRASEALQVATSVGVVRVERLGDDGQVLESRAVPAGAEVTLSAEREDAGSTVPSLEVPLVKAPAPMSPRSPSSAQLSAWRQRAGRGDCAAVLKESAAALKTAPTHLGTLRVHADCARKVGRVTEAVEGYRLVANAAPGPEAAEAMLLAAGLLQDELHDPRGVLDVTRALASLKGAPPALAAALHLRRARAFQSLGEYLDAHRESDLVLRSYATTPAAAEALRLKRELDRR